MRMLLRLLAVAVVAAAIGIGGVFIVERDPDDQAPETTDAAPTESVEIVRTDLVETETFEGTLRYRDERTIRATVPGVVTALPAEGELVRRGEPLAEVDGAPLVLLYGKRPAWRSLSTAGDDGPDVRQLEENLVALGLDPDDELTVDEDYTGVTRRLVRAWQDGLGIDDTGVVELGRVVFLPGPARIGAHETEIGNTVGPGTPLLVVTGPEQEVVLELAADRQDLAVVGDDVTVELAGGDTVIGRITEIGATARAVPGRDEPVVDVVIDLADPSAGGLDEAPVDVELVSGRADGVLAVPVHALLALAEGGYALEVLGEGPSRLVAVDIGEFADGLVEVRGDIEAGMRVLVPG